MHTGSLKSTRFILALSSVICLTVGIGGMVFCKPCHMALHQGCVKNPCTIWGNRKYTPIDRHAWGIPIQPLC